MKKIISILLSVAAALSLAGCCLRHEWSAPSCVAVQYCLNCGLKTDYLMEHQWQDADCSQPQRCAGCGMSRGSALGHVVEKAVCTVCSMQLYGDAADFEKYNIITDLQPDAVYSFSTGCMNEPALGTTGEIFLGGFGPIPTDESHPAREGYEWHYVTINAVFHDDNARDFGVTVMADCEDYYNIALRGSTQREEADGVKSYTVMKDGQEMEVRYKRYGTWSGWYKADSGRRENLYSSVWEIERPTGYDGVVVGLHSSYVNWESGKYLYDVYDQSDFYLFRLG